MKSVYTILYDTKNTLDFLDDQDEIELNIKSMFLFIFYGQIVYFKNINIDGETIHPVIDMLFTIAFILFLGTLFSLVLHKINSWLGGTASYSDVFSIISHATIPITISLIIIFFFKFLLFSEVYFNWKIIFYIGVVVGFKILIQGFLRYNSSKYLKMLLNISPIVLFYVLILMSSFYTYITYY
ncbi:hypothetical protein [uncultured Aquimarina sp.]|uniref:hypothetical protein n=1 Tax=uncultured Aquimarina sp. TaxID=575652 RepID=UPI00262A8EE7|nr:hypothetical protein [uncultured Aquimarina sp.]